MIISHPRHTECSNSQKQDECNIYATMKTMCLPGYQHNNFMTTHSLGHMMYGYLWLYIIYILYIILCYYIICIIYYIYTYIYILLIVNPYLKYFGRCLLQYLYKCHSIHRTRNTNVCIIYTFISVYIYLSISIYNIAKESI